MSSNIIISSYTLFDFCQEEYKMFIGFVIVIIRNLHFLLLSKSNYVIIGSSVFNWTLRLCISVSKDSAKWKTSKLLQPWLWFVLGLNQTPSV